MGNSTITLQDTVDTIAAMADVSPQAKPTGYDVTTTLAIANDVMNDMIARRFNWKWNSVNVPPFLTNSYQQDYPQIGLTDIGWIEDGLWIDINNTGKPLPNGQVQAAKDLQPARTTYSQYQGTYPGQVSWMYNRQLLYGAWPGPGSVYTPLLGTTPTAQNGPMAFIDAAGNILALTTFGTTGVTAPAAAEGAAEGNTVQDGTCVWTVCGPFSQGFRLDVLAPPTGPVYQINVKIQMKAVKFTRLQATLDPIPDDYAHHFRRGYKAGCYGYSTDPKTRSQYEQMRNEWLQSMVEAEMQGDREPDSFMMYPATRIVQPTYGVTRNPRDPGRPY